MDIGCEKCGTIKAKSLMDMGHAELMGLVGYLEDERFAKFLVPLLTWREDYHIKRLVANEDADKARGGLVELSWIMRIHDDAMGLAKELEKAEKPAVRK